MINSKNKRPFVLVGLLVILCIVGYVDKQQDKVILFDFENEFDVSLVAPQDASFELVKESDNSYLKVTSGFNTREPGVKLKSSAAHPFNLEGYYQVKADVTNLGDEFMQVELFVGNDPDGLKRWYCSDYADLNPHETKTITVNLAWTPWVFSPQLKVEGMRGTPGMLKTDISAINELTFCSRYAKAKNKFSIDNIRAVGRLEVRDTTGFFPFIDQLGQYKHKDWEGKMHAEDELKQQAVIQADELTANPGPKNRNIYGGWTAGPKLKSTGFFRTEKYNNKWWIVDPEGYLFWSSGLNCVSSNNANTGIEHRMHYFDQLPEKGTGSDQFYGKSSWASHGFYNGKTPYKTYNFYQSNLSKKYGAEWLDKFREVTHTRFKSWGLNTLGFVSDFGAASQHKTPYVGSVWIRGTPKIEGSKGFWGKFHDVFDPSFRDAVKKSMSKQKNGAGDPWCLGFFVDNEMSWGKLGSLSLGVLRSPETQPAKIEFIKDLKKKYKKISKLNEVWKTEYVSWKELLQSTKTPNPIEAEIDLSSFYEKIALTYFKTIKEELNVIAPKQNYLGCRFAWSNNDLVLKSASKYCDIISFNKYEYSVENIGLPKGVDRPIMIGEFHFGAVDRGSFHSGVKAAKSQTNRGELYKSYIQGALRNPLIVGAHWFQYTDQALTGRGDGENYNIGFVDICDNPYKELIEKVRETNYQLYEYRNEADSIKK